ncbi:DUF3099 domain-containing protein [Gulosibacter faecalis]|jgi:purine-cytosine permease-like protein|uniref:DUF3099 domain-containing protein n=1 Tax=Gulosibacter faecalis TaxID=272240 RepID=A0ABW5V2E9_9MICO|nr:DUF3099 domain-containing protein [Gulosibacter faecalis]
MNGKVTNVTSMTQSAEEERRARLRQYMLTMAIRTACFLLMIVVRGPFLWVLALGAIFLPMIAVMLANHVRSRRQRGVESPDAGAIVVYREPITADRWRDATENDTAKGAE